MQTNDQQQHPVWGSCAHWRFTHIDEIILHHFGGDALTLDWVILYLDDATFIKVPTENRGFMQENELEIGELELEPETK